MLTRRQSGQQEKDEKKMVQQQSLQKQLTEKFRLLFFKARLAQKEISRLQAQKQGITSHLTHFLDFRGPVGKESLSREPIGGPQLCVRAG